ncbi:MAG: ATP synthase F1 subunit delta [Chitinophagaceae bacterium]|nr:ATP synthase F1 subunit delta [Chitinophagaceae bacterium]
MLNPRLAGRYAKSLIDLSIENNKLEEVYNDMLFLHKVVKGNRDFVVLLKSPVVKGDKKRAVLDAVSTAGNLSQLTIAFGRLLVTKGRESFFPEIIEAFINQYKAKKEIYTVTLTTAGPVSDEIKEAIVSKVKSQTAMKNIELKTIVKEELIGGFLLELGNTLVDASILYDLNKIKSQFMNNDFVYKLR